MPEFLDAPGGAPHRWRAHPHWARALRFGALVLPTLSSLVVSFLLGPHLWRPAGAGGASLWFIEVVIVAASTVAVVERATRRLLPAAMLLQLSLLFPDEAPSRFGLSLRKGTIRDLERRIEVGDANAQAAHLIQLVAQMSDHDRLTRGHTERVRAYADLIGAEMGLTRPERDRLSWAAMLHDVGKVTVPAAILNKTGAPTADEWTILRGHPGAGALMVEPLAPWLGEWRHAAGQHHERWDGEGYPNGSAGDRISLAGRIVAGADAYDVITSTRSYKRPSTHEEARAEMVRSSGSHFDLAVERALLNVSLPRMRTVLGPLAWLAHLPQALQGPAAIGVGAGSTGLTAIATASSPASAARQPATPTTAVPVGPVIRGDAFSAQGNGSNPLDVLADNVAGSSDLDPAIMPIVTPAQHARQLRVVDNLFDCKRDQSYVGPDSFVYRICDTNGLCGTATVTLDLTD